VDIAQKRKRKEARRLFLTGECTSNAEIGRRLGLKPHTVAKYRKEEDWDGLTLKADRRAAQRIIESVVTERVSLETKHYNYWEALLRQVGEKIRANAGVMDTREMSELGALIEKAQRGQRLARGLSLDGENEQQIRAQGEAEMLHLIDVFIEAVKRYITDEQARDNIQRAVMETVPEEQAGGTGERQEPLAH